MLATFRRVCNLLAVHRQETGNTKSRRDEHDRTNLRFPLPMQKKKKKTADAKCKTPMLDYSLLNLRALDHPSYDARNILLHIPLPRLIRA